MLRHSVLWILQDPTASESRLAMLQRLAYLGTECPTVMSGDYGEDLFGGSRILHEVPPWERTPVWRRGAEGPACDFDLALHLDFADWDGYRAYGADPTHAEASRANELASWDELTARVDWYYDGDAPPTHSGEIKHVAMFVWADAAPDADRDRALEAVQGLAQVDGVGVAMVGRNVSRLTTDYDWIMDLRLPDRATAERVLAGRDYALAMDAVARATKHEWTARMSHVMHRP
jgi:hypothetical protein